MTWQLAQLNIGRTLYPLDDPRMRDFVDNLEAVNAHADRSDGFVWRLTGYADSDNTDNSDFGDDIIANMSVWRDVAALRAFMSSPEHLPFMKRRHEWFEKLSIPYMVMWWVPEGHIPTASEAMAKLGQVTREGHGPEAFGWAQMFDRPV